MRASDPGRGGVVDWLAKWWVVVAQGGQTTVLGGFGSEMGPEPFPIMVLLKTSKASTVFGEPKRFFRMDLVDGCLVEVEQSKVVERFVANVANNLRSGELRDDLEPWSIT